MIRQLFGNRSSSLFIPRIRLTLAGIGLLVVGAVAGLGSLAGPLSGSASATSGINKTFNFQGRLLTATGAVVADGNYNMRFRIYQDGAGTSAGNPGGTLMWTELWQNSVATGSSTGVVVKNGYFSVNLASYCAFSGGSCQGNTNSSVDFNQDTLWLSMDVAGTAVSNTPTYDGEMLPMRRLASAVYSLQADNANKLGGLTSTQYLQLAQGVQADSSTTNASIFVNKTGTTANILDLQRGGADVMLINNAGQSLFRPTTDSQTALQVQKAGTTTTAFTVDTSNSRIGIGLNNPAYAVDAVGSVNASVSVKVAGTDVCTTSGCTASATSAILNQTSQQSSSNFNISGVGVAATAFQAPLVQTTDQSAASTNSASLVIRSGNAAGTTSNSGDVTLDVGTATGTKGTLNIGTSNAVNVNIATNGAAHTIALGTGAAVQGITIGSTNTTSALTLNAGSGNVNIQATTVLGVASGSDGTIILKNATNANTLTLVSGATSTSYTTKLPAAIGATNQCLTVASVVSTTQTLGYGSCTAGTVTLQGTTPGTPDTGNINISGTGIFGTQVTSPILKTTNIRPTTDGTSAIQFQNAAGSTTVMAVDTTNSRIKVGTIGTAVGQVYVGGVLPTSTISNLTPTKTPSYVTVVGTYEYVTEFDGSYPYLQIYDISNPASPAAVSTPLQLNTHFNSNPLRPVISGRYAYVPVYNGFNGMAVVDISNPAAPALVGSFGNNGTFNAITVQGRYAYAVAGTTLWIMDITNPLNPVTVGSLTSNYSQDYADIKISGKYAYMVGPNGPSTTQLVAADITDAANPVFVSKYDFGANNHMYDVAVQGKYVYVNGVGGLQVVDMANPASPAFVTGTGGGTNGLQGLAIQGRYAYTGNDTNITIYDISNPASPVSQGNISLGANQVYSLRVQGRYMYAVVGDGTVKTYDVGGTYDQQLEAGGTSAGTLNVDGDAVIGGNLRMQGSIGTAGLRTGTIGTGSLNVASASSESLTGVVGGTTAISPEKGINTAPGDKMSAVQFTTGSAPSAVSYLNIYLGPADVAPNNTFQLALYSDSSNSPGTKLVEGAATLVKAYAWNTVSVTTTALTANTKYWIVYNTKSANFNNTLWAQDWATMTSYYKNQTYGTFPSSFGVPDGSMRPFAAFASAAAPQPNLAAQVQNASGVTALAVNAGAKTVGVGQLAAPSSIKTSRSHNTPTVANIGTAGSTSYSYAVAPVDVNGVVGQASPVQTTATGNATLGASNYNRVTLSAVSGNVVSYNVYRTASSGSPATTGFIGNTTSTTFNDQALPVLSAAVPSTTNSLTASTTYYYQITSVDSGGGESLASLEVSQATGATGRAILLSWAPVPGARSYRVYRGTSSGGETYLGTASAGSYIDDGSVSASTLTAPTAGSAYSSTLGNTGQQLTVGDGGAAGQVFVGINMPSGAISTTNVGATAHADALAVQGRYVYVGDWANSLIRVYDVNVPAKPVLISSVTTNGTTKTNGFYIAGRYLYVAGDSGVLQIYDISNPASVTFMSSVVAGSNTESVYVQGRYAYVTNYGTTAAMVFDVSNAGAPVKIGTVTVGSAPTRIVVQGRYAYLVNSTSASLMVLDMANPASPVQVGSVSTAASPASVSVQGRYAYVVGVNGLQVFDVSSPATPYLVGSPSLSVGNLTAVTVQGRYGFIGTGHGILAVDLTNPAAPVEIVGLVPLASSVAVNGIELSGRYLYASGGTGPGYMYVVDLGGTYSQTVGAGSIETGALSVRSSASFAGDMSVAGAATVGQSLNVNGDLAASGQATFKGANNSASAFQIQNPSGNSVVNVSTQTTDANLWPNPSFEPSINGAVARNSATLSPEVLTAAKYGAASLNVAMASGTNNGVDFRYPFKGSTAYAVSIWARTITGSTSNQLNMGRADNGTDADCLTNLSITTTWTQYTCVFTTGTTVGATSNVYIKTNCSCGNTILVDGLTIVAGSKAMTYTLPASALQVEPYYNNITFNAANNPELQPWQLNPNPLPAIRSRPAVATANGFVYVMGGGTGVDGATPQNTVYYAKANGDGTLGSWTTNTNNLGTAVAGSGATVMNGYIYVIGGATGTVGTSDTALVQYARLNVDGSTGAWGTTTSLPAVRDNPGVTSANGAIQVVGGNTGASSLGTCLYARPNPDGTITSWISTSVLASSALVEELSPVVVNGYIYVAGGAGSGGAGVSSLAFYAPLNADGSIGTWIDPGVNLPVARGASSTVSLNNVLYNIAGWVASGATTTVYQSALLNGGTFSNWVAGANSLPIVNATANNAGVENQRAVTLNGYVYVLGGDNNTAAQSKVYYTSGPRLKVNGSLDLTNGARSLNDTTTGGQLTAGSTAVLGTLLTADNASFLRNVSVAGNLSVGGQAVFQTSANAANAFTIQTTSGTSAVNVSTQTTDGNLWPNPSFEANINGVQAHNTGVISHNGNDLVAKFGTFMAKVVTGATANNGMEFRYPFKGSTTYAVSFWMRTDAGTANNINVGRADNGTDTDCLTSQTLTTTWTQFSCSFTTGTTIGATSNMYVKVNSTTTAVIYVDGMTLVLGSTPLSYSSPGSSLQVEPYYNQVALNSLNAGELQPWQLNPNALPAVRARASVATANGYVYVMGGGTGVDGATPQSTVYYAKVNGDGTLGSWTTNTNALGTAVAGAGAAVLNGYMYVIGGSTGAVGSTDSALVQYARLNADGSVGTWGTTTVLPAVRDTPGVVTANGAIQVIGGNTTSTTVGTTLYAKPNPDGTINNWTASSSMVTARENFQPVVSGGYVYALAGSTANGVSTTASVEYAPLNSDGSIGTWVDQPFSILPVNIGANPAVALNGYVYTAGGWAATGGNTQTAMYYWPVSNSGVMGNYTTSVNPLPIANATTARAGVENAKAVTVGGYAYVIGGDNSNAAMSHVYYTSGARTKVNGAVDLTNGSKTLSDGGAGGTLTAGNTQVVGTLSVAGDSSLNRNLTVNGGMSVGGPAMFGSSTASQTAFSIQDASGANQVNINTDTPNLISNPSFESGINGWIPRGTATVSDTTTPAGKVGRTSLYMITGNANGNGVEYRVGLKASTTYSMSFYIMRDTGTSAALSVGYNPNPPSPGSGTNDTNCTTTPSSVAVSTTWMQVSCTFTTGATIAGTSNIYIKQTDTTTDTFYIDGVTLVQSSTPLTYTANTTGAALQVDTQNTNLTINSGNNMQLQPWKMSPTPLTAGRSLAATAAWNGYIYVIGGGTSTDGGGTIQNTVYYAKANADGTLGSWNTTSALGTAVSRIQATVVNGYIYVAGGTTTGISPGGITTVQYARINADGTLGTWGTTTALPAARSWAGMTNYNGYVYVSGGMDTSNAGTTTLYYGKVNADGTISSWTTNATSFNNQVGHAQPVIYNGAFMTVGGWSSNVVEIFTLNKDGSATNRITNGVSTPALPTGKDSPGTVQLNGTVYVMGGWNGSSVDTSIYAGQVQDDRSTTDWLTMNNPLPLATENFNAVTVNGYIYVIGGDTAAATTSTIYYTSAARTQIAGSLDLVGISGKNLAEGGTGGTLTAGNTSVVGTLNVQDAASFNDNMTVAGTLSVGGNVAVKSFTNSATAFQVQNSSGTAIFTVDTSGSTVTIGSGGNTVTFASTGEPTLAGTARHAKKLVLAADYPGVSVDASTDTGGATNCSTNNNGTMTGGYAATGRQNYYNWTSTSGTDQCMDVIVQVQVPSDWAAWNGQSSMMVYNSSGTDSTSVMVNVIDTTGTNDTAYSATAYNGVSSGTTFASTNLTAYTGTYAAGGYMTFKIRMTSSSSKNVRIGNITLNYLSKW